jgi:hypothetical protein
VAVIGLYAIGSAFVLVIRINPPEERLKFVYSLINCDFEKLLLASLFSLPFAVIKTTARLAKALRVGSETYGDVRPKEGHYPDRSGFTLEELVTVIAIIGELIVLMPLVSPTSFDHREVEQYTQRLLAKRGVEPNDTDRPEIVLPEDVLIADDIPIEGRWQRQTPFVCWLDIARTEDGAYRVGAGKETAPGLAIQKRVGKLHKGELILDRPALDFLSHRIYTRLWFVRWNGQEMLIAAVNFDYFNWWREGKGPVHGPEGWKTFVMLRHADSEPHDR